MTSTPDSVRASLITRRANGSSSAITARRRSSYFAISAGGEATRRQRREPGQKAPRARLAAGHRCRACCHGLVEVHPPLGDAPHDRKVGRLRSASHRLPRARRAPPRREADRRFTATPNVQAKPFATWRCAANVRCPNADRRSAAEASARRRRRAAASCLWFDPASVRAVDVDEVLRLTGGVVLDGDRDGHRPRRPRRTAAPSPRRPRTSQQSQPSEHPERQPGRTTLSARHRMRPRKPLRGNGRTKPTTPPGTRVGAIALSHQLDRRAISSAVRRRPGWPSSARTKVSRSSSA